DIRAQKAPSPLATPKSLGSCVLARYSATPALKPIITVSEMKLTAEPARTSHARNPIAAVGTRAAAVSGAVQAAGAAKRAGSPPARLPSEEPISSEIADVTLTAVC